MVELVGPDLYSECYSSHNIHCHHPSSSEVWCTLELNTAYILVQMLGEGIVDTR